MSIFFFFIDRCYRAVIAHRLCAVFLDLAGAEQRRGRAAGAYYPRAIGLGQFSLAPLQALLWNLLPPAGWRLPATSNAVLTDVRISHEGIDLEYGPAPGPAMTCTWICDIGDMVPQWRMTNETAAAFDRAQAGKAASAGHFRKGRRA